MSKVWRAIGERHVLQHTQRKTAGHLNLGPLEVTMRSTGIDEQQLANNTDKV